MRSVNSDWLSLLLIVFLAATGFGWAAPVVAQPGGDSAAPPAVAPSDEAIEDFWSSATATADAVWHRALVEIDGNVIHVGDIVWSILVFVLVLIAVWIGRLVVRRTLLRHLGAHADTTETLLDDALLVVARQTKRAIVLILAGYVGLITLPLSDTIGGILHSIAIIAITAQAAIWTSAAVRTLIDKTKSRRVADDPSAASAFGVLRFFAQVGVWSAAFLLVLTNLGYEIGPLLAGLGVGGIAVAFALQSILGDVFCSIAIVLDKPFQVGDFIIVGDMLGTVENIGIKTTRVRSLSGEQIVFSNADLIESRIRNYKRMEERRVAFVFGVVYETPAEKLRQIPEAVRSIIEAIDSTRFDRAHFKEYGDFSLNFEVVYYVLTPDYNIYMDIQQEINLRMFDHFQEQGVSFAYPTREIIIRPTQGAKLMSEPSAGGGDVSQN